MGKHFDPGFGFYFQGLNDWDKRESICLSLGPDSLGDEMAKVDDISYRLVLWVLVVDLSEFGVGLADQLYIFIRETTRGRLGAGLF